MRKETRNKLFDGSYSAIRETAYFENDLGKWSIIFVFKVNQSFIIQEYPDPLDGFQVYTAMTHNDLNKTRETMGLPPKEF